MSHTAIIFGTTGNIAMKIIIRSLLVLLVIMSAASLWLWHEAHSFLQTPPQQQGQEIYFDVAPGANFSQIACDLATKGLITDARKFTWLARLKNQDSRLQAGRFSLNSGWTPERTLDALVNGAPVLFRVTIPEGLTWWQTAKLLENAGLVRFSDFQEVIGDPEFLRHYGIPFANAEGFLMPDTYLLRKPDVPMPETKPGETPLTETESKNLAIWQAQARNIAGRLVDNFWRKSAPYWPQKPSHEVDEEWSKRRHQRFEEKPDRFSPPASDKLQKWVILASIVEKETGIDQERKRVAGVYANRLRKNMLLQADPTVIYGLGEKFAGHLRRIHLDDATNPYNTYQNAGLPPGPICSFGTAALKAAINPEEHNYLFFVATSDKGGHTFSTNFEDHNRAVQEYRRQKKGN